MKPKLIIVVGNIGAGKSTVCRELAKKGYRVLSRDALRYMVGGGEYVFDLKLEPTIAMAHDAMFEAFVQAQEDIVIDETSVQPDRRWELIEATYSQPWHYHFTALEMPRLSKKESVDRRMQNSHGGIARKVWEGVWDKFDRLYVAPKKSEGFDRVIQYNSKSDLLKL